MQITQYRTVLNYTITVHIVDLKTIAVPRTVNQALQVYSTTARVICDIFSMNVETGATTAVQRKQIRSAQLQVSGGLNIASVSSFTEEKTV